MITNFDVIDDIDSYRNTALKNKKNIKVNLPYVSTITKQLSVK